MLAKAVATFWWKAIGGSLKKLLWKYFEIQSFILAEGKLLGTCFQYSGSQQA